MVWLRLNWRDEMAANTSNGNVVSMVEPNAKSTRTGDIKKESIPKLVKAIIEGYDNDRQ